jgi:hypothetical protein
MRQAARMRFRVALTVLTSSDDLISRAGILCRQQISDAQRTDPFYVCAGAALTPSRIQVKRLDAENAQSDQIQAYGN